MGEDNWKSYDTINFHDQKLNQFHIDTRDFCCITNEENGVEEIDLDLIHESSNKFICTPQEIEEVLHRWYRESGGKNEWRMFSIDYKGFSHDWRMKYIRIFRVPGKRGWFEGGLVVCDSSKYILPKEALKSKVCQEYLSAHSL